MTGPQRGAIIKEANNNKGNKVADKKESKVLIETMNMIQAVETVIATLQKQYDELDNEAENPRNFQAKILVSKLIGAEQETLGKLKKFLTLMKAGTNE